jgi:hypothetical protein
MDANLPFRPRRTVAETFLDLNERRELAGKPPVSPASWVDGLPGTSTRVMAAEARRWRRCHKLHDVLVAAPRRAMKGGGVWVR